MVTVVEVDNDPPKVDVQQVGGSALAEFDRAFSFATTKSGDRDQAFRQLVDAIFALPQFQVAGPHGGTRPTLCSLTITPVRRQSI